jgi:GntR family transcriptional regulator/MocR family aminotransferase
MMDLDEARWLAWKPAPGETLRAALERTLRDAIRSGALRESVRLPSSRTLAQALGVSRGVVSDAYGQLEAQGFLVTHSRAAPVVAGVARPQAVRREREKPARPPRYDLTPTTPDVTLFPLVRWLAAAQHVARRASTATLDYREPRGERALCEALADHLGRTRGVIAEPEQIVVVQGTAQGIWLLLHILSARGASRVAVEDPSHTTQHERIRAFGFELVPRPVDDKGMVVTGLAADAVLVTPAHQFPTGSVLSGERRRDLLAWSRAGGGLIVEDDYDAEFRYDREPVRALQGVAPEQVVQLGTVSKTLAPALRLGWLVAPPALADDAARTKRLLDDFSPALDQLTLAELLTRGHYDRHVRRARAVYRARRDRLLAALAKHIPELPVEGVAAGMHLLLRLPTGADDRAIADAARDAGIAVPPLSAFRVRPADDGGLVIGYGRLHESAVAAATRSLGRIIRAHL